MPRYTLKSIIDSGMDFDYWFDDFETESECYEYVEWVVFKKGSGDDSGELDALLNIDVVVNGGVKKLYEVLEEYNVIRSKIIVFRNEFELYLVGYSTETQSFLLFILEPFAGKY